MEWETWGKWWSADWSREKGRFIWGVVVVEMMLALKRRVWG